MACMRRTGPLTFFFHSGKDGDVHVSDNDVDRERSCARCLGQRQSIDRLFLEEGTFVEFLSFSAHAEDVDCRGYFCL